MTGVQAHDPMVLSSLERNDPVKFPLPHQEIRRFVPLQWRVILNVVGPNSQSLSLRGCRGKSQEKQQAMALAVVSTIFFCFLSQYSATL